jgi:hypothetical protein
MPMNSIGEPPVKFDVLVLKLVIQYVGTIVSRCVPLNDAGVVVDVKHMQAGWGFGHCSQSREAEKRLAGRSKYVSFDSSLNNDIIVGLWAQTINEAATALP